MTLDVFRQSHTATEPHARPRRIVVGCNRAADNGKARRGHIVELKAPAGKFRVVGVDLFSHEDYLKGDYASQAEAYKVADDHNTKRSGSMDDIYYVYDDQGTYIRGNEAVGQKISP